MTRVQKLEQALEKARRALGHWPKYVFNDNGDIAVTGGVPYEPTVDAYFALREIDAALSHEGDTKALGGDETWELLNDVRKFIEAEYADPSAEPDGEWLAKEARPIHDRVCRVLANSPKDAALSTPEARVRRDWHYDQDGYCDNPARGY